MATKTIADYSAANSIDAANDYLLIEPSGNTVYKKISRNVLLGLSSTPLGTTDSQSPTNKTFDNTNAFTIKDGSLTLQNTGATTRQAVFSLSSITAGQTRTITIPDANLTMVGTATNQNLTNKTIISPTITGGTIDNSTITVDSISGHTVATTVTVANLQIANGVLNTNNSVVTANIASAAVTPPKWTNAYKFAVTQVAGQSVGTAETKVTFDTKTFDTNSNFDAVTTHLYTAPVTGYYFFYFSCHTSAAASSTSVFAKIYKNGSVFTQIAYAAQGTAVDRGLSGGILMSLTAADTIGLYIGSTGAAVATIASGTDIPIFGGYLVTQT